MITVKFLKAWKGEVAVAPDATLGQLLAALHTASSIEPAACASLIVKGKKVEIGTRCHDTRIDALGIVHNSFLEYGRACEYALRHAFGGIACLFGMLGGAPRGCLPASWPRGP